MRTPTEAHFRLELTLLDRLAAVFISHAYRQVLLAGFLSTGDSNAPGNYALLDQVAALHWVKENIGAFSGDANSVTLLGHGYGAALVNLLLVSPVTRGTYIIAE